MTGHSPSPHSPNRVSTSYILWALFFVAPITAGLHRIYNRKFVSGVVWMLTFGVFGIGQLIDFVLIPEMVEEHNAKQRSRFGVSPYGVPLTQPIAQKVIIPDPPPLTPDQKMLKILKAAQVREGKISVTQAVLDTELSFGEVEETLRQMLKTGYIQIGNDPDTGVVTYYFMEL